MSKPINPPSQSLSSPAALPTGSTRSHAGAERDFFTPEGPNHSEDSLSLPQWTQKFKNHPRDSHSPSLGKGPTAGCCRQQTPSYSRSLALLWFEQGPTTDFLPNEALKELHLSCNGVQPCKLASGRDTLWEAPACTARSLWLVFQKGTGLKQLFEMQRIIQVIHHFIF